MSLQNTLLFAVLWALLGLTGCTTEDVYPTLKLEVSTNNVANDGSSMRIQVRLNGPISDDLSVPLTFSGNAQINTHFSLSAEVITVAAGSDTGFITLTALPTTDTTSRQVVVSLGDVSRVIVQTPVSQAINLVNANADRDNDGIPDISDNCPDEPGPAINNGCPWKGLIINEVLYDPPGGNPTDLVGDANGDGIREAQEDEFVEIYNDSLDYDISGFTLSDASQLRHTFPAGTIIPTRGVIVVFGGGTPTGTFGGSIVQKASTGALNLNNAGDVLTLRNTSGATVAVFDINGRSGNPDESYTRSPDVTGDFLQHSAIPEAGGRLFSPGTRLNGTNF